MKESFTSGQRLTLGLVAAVMLIAGGVMLCVLPDVNPALTAILVRVGTVLAVVWLAVPQLKTVSPKMSAVMIASALATLVLIAAQPNLFKIIGLLIVLIVILAFLAKVFQRTKF